MAHSVSKKFIEETEIALSFTFPESFKIAIEKENGATFASENDDWEMYPILDLTDKKSLARTYNDIKRQNESLKKNEQFPKNAISVGNNGCGDELILFSNCNEIFYWDHETFEVIKISEDFSNFESIY